MNRELDNLEAIHRGLARIVSKINKVSDISNGKMKILIEAIKEDIVDNIIYVDALIDNIRFDYDVDEAHQQSLDLWGEHCENNE